MKVLFWIVWSIEIVYCLVLVGHLTQQYSQIESTPLNPHVVRSAWQGILLGGIFVVGGLVLRFGFDLPRAATWFVCLPVAGYLVFFVVTAIIAMARGGFQ